jgi:ectoine hydroxylase-related dioxygenase (phytanoyl-CoA dioxygenase family)
LADWQTVCASWTTEGYCLIPQFLSRDAISRYRRIADRVYEQWWSTTFGAGQRAKASNMASLTEPPYWGDHPQELTDLLELIAHPQILGLLTAWYGQPPLFHNTQYFIEQRDDAWDGEWHRDTQFLAAEAELERARMQAGTGVHVRFAFEADSCFQIVPGSHARWDTPDEWAIRRHSDPQVRSGDMPGARTIAMQPGDMLIFQAWSVHRGRYAPLPPRRTLDIIYMATGVCDYCPPPPSSLTDPAVLAALNPQARAFYARFGETYRPFWERGEVGF